jgi:MFS family permease
MSKDAKRNAFVFVILLGLVSLFADMTYEGARSVTGPFLAILGASSLTVGLVAGLGELLGYALRLASGFITDKTRKYWTMTIIGYVINLLAVPALALASHWELAAALMIAERIGKALRNPPRDVMLSHATQKIGRGWGFGFHEAMDQIGALLGPLLVTLIQIIRGDYRIAFAFLLIPAVLAIATLVCARWLYPRPQDMESIPKSRALSKTFPRRFWLYLVAIACIAAGYVDYPLIAFHFEKTQTVSREMIPLLYAIAMGADAVAALVFGHLFDRHGFPVIIASAVISLFFSPLVFAGTLVSAIVGMTMWGIGMGAQESIMRAVVADMVTSDRRGRAYGYFNTGYGVAWFLGSALMGYLYGISIPLLIAFSMAAQAASIPLVIAVMRRKTPA